MNDDAVFEVIPNTQPKLLALDTSGVAVGFGIFQRNLATPFNAPRFGTLPLEEWTGLDFKLGHFMQWFEELNSIEKFNGLAWEKPLLVPKRDNVPKLLLLMGLVGICYALAFKYKLKWYQVDVDQVKITVTGRKDADKAAMITAAQERWKWNVEDGDQADAGGVGVYAYGMLFPLQRGLV